MTISQHFSSDYQWAWFGNQENKVQMDKLFAGFFSVSAFQQKMVQWQAIRRFQAMDNGSLQDIGIERYEIKDFVQNGGK